VAYLNSQLFDEADVGKAAVTGGRSAMRNRLNSTNLQLNKARKDIRSSSSRLGIVENEIAMMKQMMNVTHQEMSSTREINTLKEQLSSANADIYQLKKQLNGTSQRLQGSMADLIYTKQELRVTRSNLLDLEDSLYKTETSLKLELFETKKGMSRNNNNVVQRIDAAMSMVNGQMGVIHSTVKGINGQLALLDSDLLQGNKGGAWPSGSYCILQNGRCPNGFRTISGYIYLKLPSRSKVKNVKFGNSKIWAWGDETSAWYKGTAGLFIETCCK